MKYPVIILLLLLGSLSSIAQVERKTESIKLDSTNYTQVENNKNKQTQKDRLKDLDLTKEQKAKVKEIRQSGKAAKDAIEINTHFSEQEKKKQLRDLQREQAQKIQSVLTEEQKIKFKASKPNNP